MPTTRKRHTVTETDEVEAALDRVREADPAGGVNISELVVLGAQLKLDLIERERLDAQRRAELRERFLKRTGEDGGVDWQALLDVHERGWAHNPDA